MSVRRGISAVPFRQLRPRHLSGYARVRAGLSPGPARNLAALAPGRSSFVLHSERDQPILPDERDLRPRAGSALEASQKTREEKCPAHEQDFATVHQSLYL